MRWIEDQEEDQVYGGMNCVLVRVKGAAGLPADQLPASVQVEVSAFGDSLNIGETDFESDGVWETCFVGPLMDQKQNRICTMGAAKPEVKFTMKHKPAEGQVTEFA